MGFTEDVGHGTWLLMHTMLYNVNSSDTLGHYVRAVKGILALYPCERCRVAAAANKALQTHLAVLAGMRYHDRVSTQTALKLWAYHAHLLVTAHVGVHTAELQRWLSLNPKQYTDAGDREKATKELLRKLDARWLHNNETTLRL